MEALVDATNAGVGSAVSKCCVYPLDLIKTRMATTGVGFQEAVAELREEGGGGVAGLYKGLQMKLVKSVTGKFFYFYIYSSLSKIRLAQLGQGPDKGLDTLSNLVIGYFSEVLELPLIMPLEALVSRVQASKSPNVSAVEILSDVLKTKGVGALYVSFDAYLLGALQPAIQMSVFDQVKPIFLQNKKELSALQAFALGTFASTIAVTATYPMDVVRTNQQAGSGSSKGKAASFFAALATIVKEQGIQGAFKGLSAQLSQAVLSTAIMFMVKEKLTAYTKRVLLFLMRFLGLMKK